MTEENLGPVAVQKDQSCMEDSPVSLVLTMCAPEKMDLIQTKKLRHQFVDYLRERTKTEDFLHLVFVCQTINNQESILRLATDFEAEIACAVLKNGCDFLQI